MEKPPELPFDLSHPELGKFVMWIRYLEEKTDALQSEVDILKGSSTEN
jgi:hypothetical protein